MTVLAVVLTVLSGVALLVWTSRHLLIYRENRTGFVLTPQYDTSGAELPFLSVLVAAKDEQDNIARCVSTLLEQDYPNFELIVINDRSSDHTAQIVQRLFADDSRGRLVNIVELAPGWTGKNHAMWTGIKQAKGDWLLMTDADCRQLSPATLRVAMAYAQNTGADLLSVLPTLDMKGFWENVVQPVCGGIMMIWFKPDRVNDPKSPHAYANGAFMLIRRQAYEKIGTHEAVKTRVNEDIHMAQRIKQAGLKLRVVRNGGLYLVRMYTGLREILRGWARIFYGTFGTMKRLAASLAVLLVMGLTPYLAAAAGLLGTWAGGGRAWAVCAGFGLAAAFMQLSVIYRFYGIVQARQSLFWTYPLGALVGIVAVIQAMSKLRKGAVLTWRRTSYSHVDERKQP